MTYAKAVFKPRRLLTLKNILGSHKGCILNLEEGNTHICCVNL